MDKWNTTPTRRGRSLPLHGRGSDNARYRDYEMDMDARDFARNLMVTLAKDEMPISDTEFDEEILDNLAIDPFSDVRGLIALFYRNLWAMADLRETLKKYEDLEEQGMPIRWIPCSERLPETSGYYLACVYDSDVDDFDFRKNWFAHKDDYDMDESEWRELQPFEMVTAWMPLPKPYRESEG